MSISLQMRAGEDFRLDSVVSDENGFPRQLTGATGTLLVYLSPTSRTSPVLTGTVTVINANDGVVLSKIPDSATASMVGTYPHVYYFEVKVTDQNGVDTVAENGWLVVLP